MRFEVNMRDGSAYEVDASYIEVSHGPASSSYTLLGPVPGYPSAILAAFPVDEVESVLPAIVDSSPRRFEVGTAAARV